MQLNNNQEKVIMTAAISAALAVLTSGSKNKKKKKSFFSRLSKNYKNIDRLLTMTVARDIAKNERIKAKKKANAELKTKLRDLDIEDAELIDIDI